MRRLRWLVFCVAALALPAVAQDAALSGTLDKLKRSGTIVLGHRAASVPFSYLSAKGEPIGYSVDLCKLVVDALSAAIDRPLAIRWQAVTPESRFDDVASGRVDMECGSTTSNLERQKRVAFSQTVFVAGTKLMVKKGSPIRSFRDLAGRTVVVSAGTTNEKALRDLQAKFRLDFKLLAAPDHEAAYGMLASGQADAFATDDVLLAGLLAQHASQADYVVTGEFLSYDPYGLMFRKGDPAFAATVGDALRDLAASHEIERRYTRWFLQKLPGGASLDLPMTPQLEALLEAMGADQQR
jgi:ABC-type amino acid transport substrate-binding protein